LFGSACADALPRKNRDGDASAAAVQALIDVSALIRAVPQRVKSSVADYINRSLLHAIRREVAGAGAKSPIFSSQDIELCAPLSWRSPSPFLAHRTGRKCNYCNYSKS
jgi:hypothetical protein